MNNDQPKVSRATLDRVAAMFRDLAHDPQAGPTATRYLAGLCLFLLTLNGLNVLNSYVGRDFMTAIASHDRAGFWWFALLYLMVLAALTVVSVVQRWTEESLGLLWRKWLTWRIFRRYADHRVYWRLASGQTVDNPDQRIAEDVRVFTTTTLSFMLMLLNGGLTVLAFSGVLWSISPLLFAVAVAYASAGTWLTLRLGRPLIRMNYDQLDREAEFRASLIHLRENADVVALSRREDLWMARSGFHLDQLAGNFQKIIGVNRQVGFFTTGYNWLIQLIPALFVAPLFIDGRVEFGVITQAALAFTQLLGAFSLIITQFQSISSFAAVISRLSLLTDSAIAAEQAETAASAAATEQGEVCGRIGYESVTLLALDTGLPLVADLSVELRAGAPVLVTGADTARDALFRATAGIRPIDGGRLSRPPLEQILFVTERPYLCPGTLRELMLRPHPEQEGPAALCELDTSALAMADTAILAALETIGLGQFHERFGLEQTHDWDSVLSLADQQRLVLARVLACRPCFAALDRPGTSWAPEEVQTVLGVLIAQGITPIIFAPAASLPGLASTAILNLEAEGCWQWQAARNSAKPRRPG